MQEFISLINLLEEIQNLSDREWIYVNIENWCREPRTCVLYYITDDYISNLDDDEVYLDDDDLEMPISVQQINLSHFMTVGDVSYIYHKNNQDIDNTIKEINHYRKFDDFL